LALPIYDYSCECGKTFEVAKAMAEATNVEHCSCGRIGQRIYFPPLIGGTKAFEADFYHPFGKVIHNKRELQYEADKKGFVAIGNDYGDGAKMQKEFDSSRERAREKAWEKL
jgi:hypothetical protein